MNNTIDSEKRFCIYFFVNKVFTGLLKATLCLCVFIILIAAYSLNENMPQLQATFEN